jgi:Cu-Zn family superoxide dismutase
MLKYLKFLIAIVSLTVFIAGCQKNTQSQRPAAGTDTSNSMNNQPGITRAVAVLHGIKGNEVSGTVTFTKENNTIRVVADIVGLKPGKHGFHIHEYGDCSSEDGSSAGGHFNPDNVKHGAPTDAVRHVGDLGNIEADNNGRAHLEMTDSLLSFSGSHSIIGRGVILHSGTDDLVSQPSGNAGARIACGVIGIAKP